MGTSAPDLVIAGTLLLNALALLAAKMPQASSEDMSLREKMLNVSAASLNHLSELIGLPQVVYRLRRYSLIFVLWNVVFCFLLIVVFPSD